MVHIRRPCVAGHFYPGDEKELQSTVDNLITSAEELDLPAPKAIISPHAGYIYSGPIAATIYKTLIPHKDSIKKVVLIGPAHRVAFKGIAVTNMDKFATPLGDIAIDSELVKQSLTLDNVNTNDHAYDMEHSLEVQLPFLQTVLHDFTLMPCVAGFAHPQDIAQLIELLWGGPETLIVISSDLSHYHDYTTAQKLDQSATEAIVSLEPDQISDDQACGRLPVKGLLIAAKKLGLNAKVLDLRNSGDTAGDKDRVVGYGAYHFV